MKQRCQLGFAFRHFAFVPYGTRNRLAVEVHFTLFWGNVHIYESNLLNTFRLLQGKKDIKFALNVCE